MHITLIRLFIALSITLLLVSLGCRGVPRSHEVSSVNSSSDILIAGTSLRVGAEPLRLPGGSNLLTVIDEIRRAGGFRSGIFMITVDTVEDGKKVSRRMDLRRMTLR